MAKWLTGKVISNRRWNARLTSLQFEVPMGPFEAGQFVRVGLEVNDEVLARPYSLVNAATEAVHEIYFNIVPEGPLSPRLFALQPGDTLMVAEKTAGFLTMSEVPASQSLWMLATGTAIGPFLAILKSAVVWQKFQQIALCYSVRTQDELAYADILNKIAQEQKQFRFIPIITREQGPGVLHQRIPQAILDGSLELHAGMEISPQQAHVMICGSSDMITEVSAVLDARGMQKHRRRERGHYSTEKYH